jgi:hypothetical protein
MMVGLDTNLDAVSMFSFASATGRRFQDNGEPGRQQKSERRDENSIYPPSKGGPCGRASKATRQNRSDNTSEQTSLDEVGVTNIAVYNIVCKGYDALWLHG